MSKIADFFKFRECSTNYKKELVTSIATFVTMTYVLVVQPGAIVGYGDAIFIINANGIMITKEVVVVTYATINGLITLLMVLYTNLPFALATGMGSNFMFEALIQSQQLSLGGAMAMTLISGVIFLLLTIFGIRGLIVKVMSKNIKILVGTAIDFFITYLGSKNTGVAALTESGTGMGNPTDPAVALAVLGLVIIATLTMYKVNDVTLISIVIVTLLGIPAGVTTVSSTFAKAPGFTGLGNVILNLGSRSVLSFSSVILIFTAFYGDFFSTLGIILGVSAKVGMLDENGDLPSVQQPFLINAIDICVGTLTGDTVITTFVESNAGMEAGGCTGFTSIVVSITFMIMVLLSPLVLMIPNTAAGPALIFVGFPMISGFKDIDFTDFTESFGPFIMVVFTVSTGSITSGISTGILTFVLIKTATGKLREVHPITYIMTIPLICYFIYG